MFNHKSSFFLLICFLLIVLSVSAQENSPYSRFGIGDLHKQSLSSQKGFGHLGAAVQTRNRINTLNPASYAAIGLTTFEPSIYFHRSNFTISDSTYQSDDASIEHFVFGFPITDTWGLVLGILPYASSNYHFETTGFSNQNQTAFAESFKGDGNLYELILGSGRTFGNLSVGLQTGLIFGRYNTINLLSFPESTNILNTRKVEANRFSAFTGLAGVQYRLNLYSSDPDKADPNRVQYLMFGATANGALSLNVTQDRLWQRFVYTGTNNVSVIDTISMVQDNKISSSLPVGFSAGVSYNLFFQQNQLRRQLMIGAEFESQLWSEVEDVLHGTALGDYQRVSFGLEYTPHVPTFQQLLRQIEEGAGGRLDNYFQRVSYRVGGYFGNTPVEIDGQQVNEFGITFGIGLPVRSFFNKINLSIEAGSRGDENGRMFNENFIRGYIGFTLNDRWFVQRQFD